MVLTVLIALGAVAPAAAAPLSATPGDPLRARQWAHGLLSLRQIPVTAADGTGVVVAVLDTGVQADHPDLAGRVDCSLGADFAADQPAEDPAGDGCTDTNGHGTEVAGIVSAVTDNGIGVGGVSAATIMPVRVLDADGEGTTADIVAGIDHAVANGADVINLSLGNGDATGFARAVTDAVDAGVVVLAAAGDNRLEGNAAQYPAATPGALAVAAIDTYILSATTSRSGPRTWISAPGVDIHTTTVTWQGSTPVYGYGTASGTGMATAHVSGGVARYLDRNPGVSPDAVRSALANTAIDVEHPGLDDNTGTGIVDIYELALGHQPSRGDWRDSPAAAPALTSVVDGDGSVTVEWTAPGWPGLSPITEYVVGVAVVTESGFAGAATVRVPAGQLSATIPGLAGGSTYVVAVYAVNSRGRGQSATSEQVAVLSSPTAPRIGTPSVTSGAARARWTTPVSSGGAAIAGYVVKAYDGWNLVQSETVGPAVRDHLFRGLTNGRSYTFLVQAVNAVGTSVHSARSARVTPMAKPTAPRIGTPRAADNAVRVYWAQPSSTGGSAVTRYVIRVYQGTKGVKSVTASGSARSLLVTGLRNRASYRFTVTAQNSLGPGPASARSAAVTTR